MRPPPPPPPLRSFLSLRRSHAEFLTFPPTVAVPLIGEPSPAAQSFASHASGFTPLIFPLKPPPLHFDPSSPNPNSAFADASQIDEDALAGGVHVIGDIFPAAQSVAYQSSVIPLFGSSRISQGLSPQEAPAGTSAQAKKSYADATCTRALQPSAAFTQCRTPIHPTKIGDATFIQMPDDIYSKRLQSFQFALIGRLFQPKGTTPRPIPDLKSELLALFRSEEDWSLTPLGKGYFSLKFRSISDMNKAYRTATWRLKAGSFHLRVWKPDFDPYKEQRSVAQVWVRLYLLPEEYWDTEFLLGVFRAVGNVVKLDGSTAMGLVGHFARALVEVDLNLPLLQSVTINRADLSFQVEFSFENLPLFCNFCKFVGHSVESCRHSKWRTEQNLQAATQPKQNTSADHPPDKHQVWVEKKRASPVHVSNAFQALDTVVEAKTLSPSSEPITQQDGGTVSDKQTQLEGTNAVSEVAGVHVDRILDGDPSTGANDFDNNNFQHWHNFLDLSNDKLDDLARRIHKLSGRERVEANMLSAFEEGKNPTAYAIDPGNNNSISDMEDVACKQWNEVLDKATSASRTNANRSL